jgi:pimeloyl-ACP methyl ester carboxylesterase
VGTNDQSVHPDLERAAAKRMNGNITEVASSHVPMLSRPDVVLSVIREAAKSC